MLCLGQLWIDRRRCGRLHFCFTLQSVRRTVLGIRPAGLSSLPYQQSGSEQGIGDDMRGFERYCRVSGLCVFASWVLTVYMVSDGLTFLPSQIAQLAASNVVDPSPDPQQGVQSMPNI